MREGCVLLHTVSQWPGCLASVALMSPRASEFSVGSSTPGTEGCTEHRRLHGSAVEVCQVQMHLTYR